jgi:hypothetical protein
MEERKGENKGWHLKNSYISPLILLDSSFISPFYIFLFLYTSFIFDRGHVTDLLRYVFHVKFAFSAKLNNVHQHY